MSFYPRRRFPSAKVGFYGSRSPLRWRAEKFLRFPDGLNRQMLNCDKIHSAERSNNEPGDVKHNRSVETLFRRFRGGETAGAPSAACVVTSRRGHAEVTRVSPQQGITPPSPGPFILGAMGLKHTAVKSTVSLGGRSSKNWRQIFSLSSTSACFMLLNHVHFRPSEDVRRLQFVSLREK